MRQTLALLALLVPACSTAPPSPGIFHEVSADCGNVDGGGPPGSIRGHAIDLFGDREILSDQVSFTCVEGTLRNGMLHYACTSGGTDSGLSRPAIDLQFAAPWRSYLPGTILRYGNDFLIYGVDVEIVDAGAGAHPGPVSADHGDVKLFVGNGGEFTMTGTLCANTDGSHGFVTFNAVPVRMPR